jgi:hypothetical protein
MSCGLGAIILVFMLVKHNVDNSSVESELLSADLSRLESQQKALRDSLAEVQGQTAEAEGGVATSSAEIARLKAAIAQQKSANAKDMAQLKRLEQTIKTTEVAKPADVIAKDAVGEQNYVMGLKVEGQRIAILLDASASMTDEKLLDVIRRKTGSDADKRQGPKWKRSQEIVRWLLARLPKDADVSVIAFNDKAQVMGAKAWVPAQDANALGAIYQSVQAVVPSGPTNLQKGLMELTAHKPSNVYIITDGLPTDGESNYRSLNPFASCGSLLRKATTISGECRVKLFRQTLAESAPRAGVVVNVILLPIEGDPEASPEFWVWTAETGGLLITPAENWP